MLEDDNGGSSDALNSAAQCAKSDWDGVPHSAKSDLAEATILAPQKRNRRWDPREKVRITAGSFEPGANISAVARHHGVSPGLLHYWRRTVRDRAAMEPISFVPLEVDDGVQAAEGSLEIEFEGAHVVVRGAVDAGVLRVVCETLRQHRAPSAAPLTISMAYPKSCSLRALRKWASYRIYVTIPYFDVAVNHIDARSVAQATQAKCREVVSTRHHHPAPARNPPSFRSFPRKNGLPDSGPSFIALKWDIPVIPMPQVERQLLSEEAVQRLSARLGVTTEAGPIAG
ncbi:transposase [Novosphingobium sp. AP12]|nr:transposase [Novosphingobium sp. AP12]